MNVVKDIKKRRVFYEQLIELIVKEYKFKTLKDIAFSLLEKGQKLNGSFRECLGSAMEQKLV